MTAAARPEADLGPVPEGFDRHTVEQFLYREARLADEGDYDAWEALWTDDALYWVPIGGEGGDPQRQMSVIYDNRNRISTRLKQLRTGKRYAQAPPSNLRRMLSSAAETIPMVTSIWRSALTSWPSSRVRGAYGYGVAAPPTGSAAKATTSGSHIKRWFWWTMINRCPRWVS
jgi:Ring hydroxylating beta subunit